jgi:hypothetical protein
VPNVIQAVITKFEAAKFLDKYKSVSAPGAAGPNEKQSFIKLTVLLMLLRQKVETIPSISTLSALSSEWTSHYNNRKSRRSSRVTKC